MSVFILCIVVCDIILVTAAEEQKLWRDDCRCGEANRLDDGSPGQCNPESSKPCCSDYIDGWCGGSELHCHCYGCIDYRDPAKTDEEILEVSKTEALKICFEAQEVGPCQERHRRWWYNNDTRHCQIFYWSGCHSNRNNFKTRYECEHTCFDIEKYQIIAQNKNVATTLTPPKEDKCYDKHCRPHAECNPFTGQCECAKSYTGDPEVYQGCSKILLVADVMMDLRQFKTEDLSTILEGPFCSDLLITREKPPCSKTNDPGYMNDSTTVQYMECEDDAHTPGHCSVVEEYTEADNSSVNVHLRISIEEGWLKIPIVQFIKERINGLPGIFDRAANSLIWLNRPKNSSQFLFIAMKWDTIMISSDADFFMFGGETDLTLHDTFAKDLVCVDLVEKPICSDLTNQGKDVYGTGYLWCHADTGDDLCRQSCGFCEAYQGNETCFNTVDFCRELVKSHHDACNKYKEDMQILCPFSCGFCNNKPAQYAPWGICDDLNNYCDLIRDTYGCGNIYITYHKQHLQCQKTCGLCESNRMLPTYKEKKKIGFKKLKH